jgi:translocation and assembly module TamA
MEEKDYAFLKGYGNWKGYAEIFNSPDVTAAMRLAAGTIDGASTVSVPADERFYAGGGGSVRGYTFQSVGPLDGETPLGGRSLLEMSFECRFRVTDRLGLVTFLDGGTAFSGNHFETDEDIRWGTGIGFRYFTPVGPIRFDVGFPLNRRAHMDDSFQIYVNLGQSF